MRRRIAAALLSAVVPAALFLVLAPVLLSSWAESPGESLRELQRKQAATSVAFDGTGIRLSFLNASKLNLTGGNVKSIEGGVVLRLQDGYGLFTTDKSRGIIRTRLVYFKASTSDGPFEYSSQLVCCSSGVYNGTDNRAALWAPMPSFDGDLWHLFYVQYAAAPPNQSGWYDNFHGEIMHAVSQTGDVGGPYGDVGVVLQPDDRSQAWEGLQGTDSISPPFRLRNGSIAAFYGSAHTEARGHGLHSRDGALPLSEGGKWNVGLALAARIGAPFHRVTPESLVKFNGGHVENPIVIFLAPFDIYLALFDYLGYERQGFGASASLDGLHWSPGVMVPVEGGVRTPQGAFLEEDNQTMILFFSRGDPEKLWRATLQVEQIVTFRAPMQT